MWSRGRIRQSVWLILMVGALAAAISSIYGISTRSSPAIEVEKDGDLFVITEIYPGSEVWYNDGRVGHVITSVNGQPSANFDALPDLVLSLDIATSRDTEAVRITIGVGPASLAQQTVTLLLLAGAFTVMSMFLFIRAERTTEVVLFAVFTASAAATLAIGPASLANHAWARLAQGVTTATSSIYFLTFFIVFARETTGRQRIQLRNLPEYSTGCALVTTLLWLAAGTLLPELFPVMRNGTLILLAASFLIVLVLLPWRYRTATANRKEQLRFATIGTTIGLFPFIWLSIIPQAVTGESIIAPEASILALALLPLSFGYSILRHQLLGISRLVHRGATYALITAMIVAVYGSVLTVLNLFAADSTVLRNVELILLFVMFAGVPLIAGVRSRAMRLADRLLYPDLKDRSDLIGRLNSVISSFGRSDALLQRSISVVGQGLGVGYAFASHGSGSAEISGEYGTRPTGFLPDGFSSQIGEHSGIIRVSHDELESEFLAGTVRGIKGIQGNMVLGPRTDGAPFDSEDIRIFQLVCGIVSGELVRTQLMEEVELQQRQLESIGEEVQRIQEDERSELSSYIHDEPLQKVAYALAQMRERALPEDLAGVLEEVARDLRNTSASLSPDILRRAGLATAISLLVKEQGHRSQFGIFLDVESMSDADRFDEDIELALYRTVREGLNNARKYANAKAVWVQLSYEAGALKLSVDDNGVGLSEPSGEPTRIDQNLGLRGLERRITQLGGTLTISPRASRGTSLTVRISATKIDEPEAR